MCFRVFIRGVGVDGKIEIIVVQWIAPSFRFSSMLMLNYGVFERTNRVKRVRSFDMVLGSLSGVIVHVYDQRSTVERLV